LPADAPGPAPWNERLSIFPLIFIPWLILYMAIGHIPVPNAIDSRLAFEKTWPVIIWTEAVYVSPYVIITAVPFVISSRRILREFAVNALVATLVVHLLYLCIPLVSPPRPPQPDGLFGHMLLLEQSDG